MKLINKYEISQWAFWQCLNGNDTEEIRSLIMDKWFAYLYCYYIKDILEVRKYITNKVDLNFLEKLRNDEVIR